MNSVDAKAATCRVTIEPNRVVIEDDGTGITRKEDIERFFETFGQPHEESEGKRYGTFRMGRGQLFAFGHNRWRTGPFEMEVDIKELGLDYDLHTVGEAIEGCRIEIKLYEPLRPSGIADAERTVKRWCKYAQLRLIVNGETCTVDPAAEKWDHVTDEAYVRLTNAGPLAVYNLGVHVFDLQRYQYGASGVVVSRKQLRTNFARNDVQSDCPIWRKVRPLVDQMARQRTTRKKAMSDAERAAYCRRVAEGEVDWNEVDTLKLITLVDGTHISPRNLSTRSCRQSAFAVGTLGDPTACQVHRRQLATVVARESLERFGASTLTAVGRMFKALDGCYEAFKLNEVDLDSLAANIEGEHRLFEDKDLTPREKVWVRLLDYHKQQIRRIDEGEGETAVLRRTIRVGEGPSDLWTDALTYVAFNRDYLKELDFDVAGLTRVGLALLHEICLDGPDLENRDCGPEFYVLFHDSAPSVATFVDACLQSLPKIAKSEGRELDKRALRSQDRVAAVAQSRTDRPELLN